MKKKLICNCLTCGKSSNAGNICAYEETTKMAFCPTKINMPKHKKEVK